MWKYTGIERPPFAIAPEPGQESVWDYPRPPALVADGRRVEVRIGDTLIADSYQAYRVLETASPPTFYIPAADVNIDMLMPVSGRSMCEWKGAAQYWGLKLSPKAAAIGWNYPHPTDRFAGLKGAFSFYPGLVECYVAGERVRPQPGGFYGGWITDEIVGPVKGDPGTGHW